LPPTQYNNNNIVENLGTGMGLGTIEAKLYMYRYVTLYVIYVGLIGVA
jgi:hypothetical protein